MLEKNVFCWNKVKDRVLVLRIAHINTASFLSVFLILYPPFPFIYLAALIFPKNIKEQRKKRNVPSPATLNRKKVFLGLFFVIKKLFCLFVLLIDLLNISCVCVLLSKLWMLNVFCYCVYIGIAIEVLLLLCI